MQVDEPTYARWQQEAPELTKAVSGEDGARVMLRDAKTDACVKFADGLCAIQTQQGPDMLSDSCHLYPRMTRKFGNTITITAALSCPEVARLALFQDDAFAQDSAPLERLPHSLRDYMPAELQEETGLRVHQAFMQAALDETHSPARNCMRIVSAAQSLERISVISWPEAAPFYLSRDSTLLLPPEPKTTDPFFLLQALCGLAAAARKTHIERLMHTIHMVEEALHCTIRWETLAIAHLPDSLQAAASLQQEWQQRWAKQYAPVLRRYLAAQISLALFPFGGFGGNAHERSTIIGVRFATLQLALMCACRTMAQGPTEADCVRITQSLSRLLDHLGAPEFSLKIYTETGWTNISRLRALLADV